VTPFAYLSGALSFVLGLAVTLLLTSLLAAFRARRKCRTDWIPLAWATYILVFQFDYWWEIYALATVPAWSVGSFVFLLALTILLFLAGGLVLPPVSGEYPTDLGEYFRRDGRWGVAMLGAYALAAAFGNVFLFKQELTSAANLSLLAALVILAIVIASERRGLQVAGTLLLAPWMAIHLWLYAPHGVLT
jgi:hypothetical protein